MTTTQSLSSNELNQYSRHLIMPEVGMEGQLKLKNTRVLCVGVGGLGSPLALYLAAAGVGRIGLMDNDVVDYSNLHRQVLHHPADVGRPKTQSAAKKLMVINPNIDVIEHPVALSAGNALEIMRNYDIVADGTDNFPTRYLINDACVLLGIPNVHASIFRFDGQASVFYAREGPCYRCLYPDPPPSGEVPSCAESGVLGILPGLLGMIQSTEVIKLILGQGKPLIGRLVMIDALEMKVHEMRLDKDPDCPICGNSPSIDELIDYDQFCGFGGEHLERDTQASYRSITAGELNAELGSRDIVLIDVREPMETEVSTLDHAVPIPLRELAMRMEEFNKNQEIVVYCLSDVRSVSAAAKLSKLGFSRVSYLKGGMISWVNDVNPEFRIF